ncbi:MAG: PEP-CTERM sorting domain-containing protein [Pseudobdellovibrionaceae bacterium]
MRKLLFFLMSLVLVMLPGWALASVDGRVPEPSTMLLLVSGLLGLWGFRKMFGK